EAEGATLRGIGEQLLEARSPFIGVAGEVTAAALFDDGEVAAHRRADDGPAGGEVLQDLERALAACPRVVGQGHDADVTTHDVPRLVRPRPGLADDLEPGVID